LFKESGQWAVMDKYFHGNFSRPTIIFSNNASPNGEKSDIVCVCVCFILMYLHYIVRLHVSWDKFSWSNKAV
jgi:hypothetical protein